MGVSDGSEPVATTLLDAGPSDASPDLSQRTRWMPVLIFAGCIVAVEGVALVDALVEGVSWRIFVVAPHPRVLAALWFVGSAIWLFVEPRLRVAREPAPTRRGRLAATAGLVGSVLCGVALVVAYVVQVAQKR